jgi:hypothetical protein
VLAPPENFKKLNLMHAGKHGYTLMRLSIYSVVYVSSKNERIESNSSGVSTDLPSNTRAIDGFSPSPSCILFLSPLHLQGVCDKIPSLAAIRSLDTELLTQWSAGASWWRQSRYSPLPHREEIEPLSELMLERITCSSATCLCTLLYQASHFSIIAS